MTIHNEKFKHNGREYRIEIRPPAFGNTAICPPVADTYVLEVFSPNGESIYGGTVSHFVAYGIYKRWGLKPVELLMEDAKDFIQQTDGGTRKNGWRNETF